jgi:hypothetical protein
LRVVDAGGLTTPRLETAVDAAGRAHLFFFEDSGDPGAPYAIRHLEVDPGGDGAAPRATETLVAQVDNCAGLSAALLGGSDPLVLYQGGVERDCGQPVQSDVMVSLAEAGGWREYTAAIGEVERNPVFFDGLAWNSMAAATDSAGRIHGVFQFFYEGCDAMNFRYPDLRYVSAAPSALDPSRGLTEETVEGNDYAATNAQNRVGDEVCLAIDGDDRPVAFYGATLADGTQGLRTARRESGGWVHEWVETGVEVGRVSCATSPTDGSVAVAYRVARATDGRDDVNCLRFAERGAAAWEPHTVDDRTQCGYDCSLAFDGAGAPAIAYRSARSHTGRALDDLKLARRGGSAWADEEVATTGDLGHGNRVWFAGGVTHIATYSEAQRTIFLLSCP